jgi:putative toxin-antitoxin system antitoxin component (TIGR02293 family)
MQEFDEIAGIVKVLGVSGALQSRVHDFKDLEKLAIAGLPKKSLNDLAEHLALGKTKSDIIYKFIPSATYKRRKTLSPEVSEKIIRVARLYAIAQHVLGSQKNAEIFLTQEHPLLENRKPYEVALTEIGARRVEEILWNICYGLVL